MPDEAPVYEESMTSAAIDGARIAVATADVLVSLDERIPEDQCEAIRARLAAARGFLDEARIILQVPTTSVHIVRASPGGIIIPGT